ncbi:MAG: DUF1573 domain-containing protein [Bacteroidetes bacterium]|nr:DUF1573 domain-containing protein [Bacteroidota bacterium]MBL0052782.1 DUF1573 domain-containing protein [Bacteroidota bacterium]
MMKKSILILAFAAFTVAGFAQTHDAAVPAPAAATPQAEVKAVENPNAPEFKFAEEEYNFGTIKSGEAVTHEYTFTNTGKEPLVITSAAGSCGCTVPKYPQNPIKKGESGVITVTFNSTGKQGMQDKTVTIQSNAKGGAKVIHIKGNVTKVETPAVATPAATPEVH